MLQVTIAYQRNALGLFFTFFFSCWLGGRKSICDLCRPSECSEIDTSDTVLECLYKWTPIRKQISKEGILEDQCSRKECFVRPKSAQINPSTFKPVISDQIFYPSELVQIFKQVRSGLQHLFTSVILRRNNHIIKISKLPDKPWLIQNNKKK